MKTLDTLLNGTVKIWQQKTGWKVSQDAVVLAHFINPKAKDKSILDVGCGNGGITLCLSAKCQNKDFTCIDIQTSQLSLFKESIEENHFTKLNTYELLEENLQEQSPEFKNKNFDIVMTNPPYYKGLASPDDIKALAHTEQPDFPLTKWIEQCFKKLKSRGQFYIIHQAERLDDIILGIKASGGGAVEIFPIYSIDGDQFPKRIIVKAEKSSKTLAKLHKGVYLYEQDKLQSKSEMYKKIFNI